MHAIPISSFSTKCGRVCTEETGLYVHCVNGLDQNADWYVNRHGVDHLSGSIVIYSGCHARRVVLCYTFSCPSVCSFLCAQLLLQFPSELDLFEICHKGIQSFRHPVISTPSEFNTVWSFRPIFWSIRPTNFYFLHQMVVSTPFIFLVPNIEQKKKFVFLFAQYCCK